MLSRLCSRSTRPRALHVRRSATHDASGDATEHGVIHLPRDLHGNNARNIPRAWSVLLHLTFNVHVATPSAQVPNSPSEETHHLRQEKVCTDTRACIHHCFNETSKS